MHEKNRIFCFGRLIIALLMVLCGIFFCFSLCGCDSGGDSEDGNVRVHETYGTPPVIEKIEFRRYIDDEYMDVSRELYPIAGHIYHFDSDEDISFEITAYDPDLDMKEVTITTYDVFDMETGEPTEYFQAPASGPDIHIINWCEHSSICDNSAGTEGYQREETATFFLRNVLRLNTGWRGPKQIWITIQDLGNNSSEHYILYARAG
jgi:hypothetical protein